MAVEALASAAAPRRRFSLGNPWHLLVFLLVAGAVVVPLVMLVLGSFSPSLLKMPIHSPFTVPTTYQLSWVLS